MKLILKPITVQVNGTTLTSIAWEGRSYRVSAIEDTWVSQTGWWAQPEKRVYYRVCTDTAIMEIYTSDKNWILSRIFD